MVNVFVAGPSGSGKTTIIMLLIKKYNLERVITNTTRQPRYNEVDGVDYTFLTKEYFKENQEKFFEIEEYNGNFYGTMVEQVIEKEGDSTNKIISLGKRGIESLKEKKVPGIYIFIYMDKDVLRDRLVKRLNKESLTEEEISSIEDRLSSYDIEYNYAMEGQYDFLIRNDNLEKAVEEVERIFDGKITKRE
ncbi:Guanylate kinase [Spraguea lophii 42_110]|uniref:Guanylate kinase n=1 Tax=Spraguea lophii (strain 42_110) TaxID=1358809 RepID=S7XF88_SPRLO|nr:Guanylate kinase [Spraguea lophii 42_110]